MVAEGVQYLDESLFTVKENTENILVSILMKSITV